MIRKEKTRGNYLKMTMTAHLQQPLLSEEAKHHFQHSALANSVWEIEKWDNAMLETALHIAQKWKNKV